MRFACTISRRGEKWLARHESAEWGIVSAQADSRQDAIEKLRGELRYRLEICPCTGESYQHIEVDIVEQ
jgi:hypothetical protein